MDKFYVIKYIPSVEECIKELETVFSFVGKDDNPYFAKEIRGIKHWQIIEDYPYPNKSVRMYAIILHFDLYKI